MTHLFLFTNSQHVQSWMDHYFLKSYFVNLCTVCIWMGKAKAVGYVCLCKYLFECLHQHPLCSRYKHVNGSENQNHSHSYYNDFLFTIILFCSLKRSMLIHSLFLYDFLIICLQAHFLPIAVNCVNYALSCSSH